MSDLILDIGWLKEEYGNDLEQIFQIYKEENNESLRQLKLSFKNNDHEGIRMSSHKMKGSSRILGAVKIEALAFQIETTYQSDDLGSIIEELERRYYEVIEYLKVSIKTEI